MGNDKGMYAKDEELEKAFNEWNKGYKTDIFKLNPRKPKELLVALTAIIKDSFYGGVYYERKRIGKA